MPAPARVDWGALGRSLRGELLLPGSEAYDCARRPFIARFDVIEPQAVVRCAAPADVVEALAFVRQFGLATAVRSGGHDLAGGSSTSGVLLDLTLLDTVELTDGSVRLGAGVRNGALYERLSKRGVAIPTGTCPSVGIGGLTLGGGLGILGRKHGLTCDQLLAAEVVLADGQVMTCDSSRHSDLFWGLRGAGTGGLGIVTEFTFQPVRVPETTTSFRLVWPHARAAAVIEAWQQWAPEGPDELDAELALSAGPDSGSEPTVEVVGAFLGGEAQAESVLAELTARVRSEPSFIDRRELSYLDTCRFQAELSVAYDLIEQTAQGERRRQGYRFTTSEFFARRLPPEGITALVDALSTDRRNGQNRSLWFGPWGGAYNRRAADATAFPHRDQLFILEYQASVAPAAPAHEKRAAGQWAGRSRDTLHRWGSGSVYPAFPDCELADWEFAYYREHASRLREIKRAYDPDNLLRGTHTISPPSGSHAAQASV